MVTAGAATKGLIPSIVLGQPPQDIAAPLRTFLQKDLSDYSKGLDLLAKQLRYTEENRKAITERVLAAAAKVSEALAENLKNFLAKFHELNDASALTVPLLRAFNESQVGLLNVVVPHGFYITTGYTEPRYGHVLPFTKSYRIVPITEVPSLMSFGAIAENLDKDQRGFYAPIGEKATPEFRRSLTYVIDPIDDIAPLGFGKRILLGFYATGAEFTAIALYGVYLKASQVIRMITSRSAQAPPTLNGPLTDEERRKWNELLVESAKRDFPTPKIGWALTPYSSRDYDAAVRATIAPMLIFIAGIHEGRHWLDKELIYIPGITSSFLEARAFLEELASGLIVGYSISSWVQEIFSGSNRKYTELIQQSIAGLIQLARKNHLLPENFTLTDYSAVYALTRQLSPGQVSMLSRIYLRFTDRIVEQHRNR